MRLRHHGFALSLALLVAPAGAFAQAPKADESILQATLAGPEFVTITRVDPDGTILLGPSDSVAPQIRDILGAYYAEGFYLLVTNDSKPASARRVLRVQITDVAAGSVFTLKTGAQAAARVRVNDTARLVRPVPTTTARLRALPDEIPLLAERSDAIEADPREDAARARSINNVKQIGLAVHNFLSVHGKLPPAVIFGPDGKPWHSWRVLLLPYLERVDLYNDYDFSQPWDSPKNKALLDKMPDVYRDPIHGDKKESFTHYAAFVGPTSVFRPEGAKQIDPKSPPLAGGSIRLQNITDGTSNTVIVSSVEPARKIPWTKPEDIDVGPAFKGFGPPGGIAAPYTFRGPGGGKAAPFLFCDGSVRMIGASVRPQVLAALLTCAGGEVISRDAINDEAAGRQVDIRTLKIRLNGARATATVEPQALESR
jgi:prepilin-type processing-associated H-X9-DG protein